MTSRKGNSYTPTERTYICRVFVGNSVEVTQNENRITTQPSNPTVEIKQQIEEMATLSSSHYPREGIKPRVHTWIIWIKKKEKTYAAYTKTTLFNLESEWNLVTCSSVGAPREPSVKWHNQSQKDGFARSHIWFLNWLNYWKTGSAVGGCEGRAVRDKVLLSRH